MNHKQPAAKVRRKIKAAERNQQTARKERKEGDTYRSGMAMSNETLSPSIRLPLPEKLKKIWVPTPLETFAKQQIKSNLAKDLEVVSNNLTFFDLETRI
jgi:hypothetical protein